MIFTEKSMNWDNITDGKIFYQELISDNVSFVVLSSDALAQPSPSKETSLWYSFQEIITAAGFT